MVLGKSKDLSRYLLTHSNFVPEQHSLVSDLTEVHLVCFHEYVYSKSRKNLVIEIQTIFQFYFKTVPILAGNTPIQENITYVFLWGTSFVGRKYYNDG